MERMKQKLKSVYPSGIQFGLLSAEEILKLSVAKITRSVAFDAIGHPLPSGLYDPFLGPIENTSLCATCMCNLFKCPGHFGHIDLPLPVINPLFHRNIFKLLSVSCLKCHTISIPYKTKFIFINQLRLLNQGNINDALDYENNFKSYDYPNEFTKEMFDSMMSELNSKVSKNDLLKNVFEGRYLNEIHESFVNNCLKTVSSKICVNCNCRLQKIRHHNKQILTYVRVHANEVKEGESDKTFSGDGHTIIVPSESMAYLRKIWVNDVEFLNELMPVLKSTSTKYPTDLFFFTVIPVIPSNCRLPNLVKGCLTEHNFNSIYNRILDDCVLIKSIIHLMKNTASVPETFTLLINQLQGASLTEKLSNVWKKLQGDCDLLLSPDSKMIKGTKTDLTIGLKQVLEKKQGILRMNIMGKRVNFAARSVITPDPNLNVDEIGIPEEFAKVLTFPVPVTHWNVRDLRKIVINGPDVHPGAVIIEMEDGIKVRISTASLTERESLANRLLTPSENSNVFKGIKTVHRHLMNGDILLMNRQPSLHKPSIMAHRARILKGEKTIRMHYSNCKSYNADFDGDEMNAHFPQNQLARSEGVNIVNVCKQYLVPKDGTPLGGLIQDHMISGVRLSVRGRFFTQDDYMQLVFQAVSFVRGDIKYLPPSILKPDKLWSGKQIISTVILNTIPKEKKPINLVSTAKINAKAWCHGSVRKWNCGGTPFSYPNQMTEAEVIIRNGELLCGVLDKTHYGATPYSLIHCVYELYGGECSSKLLSALGKLFTAFLQKEGFSLSVKDILVKEEADEKRLNSMQIIKDTAKWSAYKALDFPVDANESELKSKLEEAYLINPKFRQIIDREYKNTLDSLTNDINTACVPYGLIERFPYNNLQLMVQSGAKGSLVNTMQISCLLGQIELEGKRPPLMISGRSLPSFPPYDTSARAGGFIDGRFMTGILPQEFFFHCMAGREGLIDTAVKTSRSGYLQRCLIKHLEGIMVNYDMTVRDSDGAVIQFLYGEDGMDVSKAQFFKMKQLPFLMNNLGIFDQDILNISDDKVEKVIKKHKKQVKSWNKFTKKMGDSKLKITPFMFFCKQMEENFADIPLYQIDKKNGRSKRATAMCKKWQQLDEETKKKYYKKCKLQPDPLNSKLQPDRDFGSISDKLDSLINDYMKTRKTETYEEDRIRQFKEQMQFKSMISMCNPGEPVGVLAAQSIGEPSTQMTLNTFHFAGRGEMNVTLGIPRLREILMLASREIKTPSIEIPFKDIPKVKKEADKLRKYLTRLTLAEVLEYVSVTERHCLEEPNRRQLYDIYFKMLPRYAYINNTHIKPKHIIRHIERVFLKEINRLIPKGSDSSLVTTELGKTRKKRVTKTKTDEADDDDIDNVQESAENPLSRARADSESSEEELNEDEDATAAKLRACKNEEQDYEDKEEGDDISIKSEDEGLMMEYNSEKEDDPDDDNKTNEESKRAEEIIALNENVENYRYDSEKYIWCEVTFSYPFSFGRIDFASLLKEGAAVSVIHEVPGIKRAFVYESGEKLMLKTDGYNISEIFKNDNILDVNKLYSNNIYGISLTYGVEAAAKALAREVQDVFKVYGITVDPRHLVLIADYMTFSGRVKGLNRASMAGSVSTLQQMSFEASSWFLKTGVIHTKKDNLKSPSGSLTVGCPSRVGTGIMDVRAKVESFF